MPSVAFFADGCHVSMVSPVSHPPPRDYEMTKHTDLINMKQQFTVYLNQTRFVLTLLSEATTSNANQIRPRIGAHESPEMKICELLFFQTEAPP